MTHEEELKRCVAILKEELQKPECERKVNVSMRRTIQIIGMSPERARKNIDKN